MPVEKTKLPNKPLYEFEIDEKYRNEKKFGGSYSINQLPEFKQNKFYFILYHQPNENSGHWICVVNESDKSWIVDSFGLPPDPRIIKKLKKLSKQVYYNTFQFQDIEMKNCGYYSMYIIDEWFKGKKMETIIDKELNKVGDNKEDYYNIQEV